MFFSSEMLICYICYGSLVRDTKMQQCPEHLIIAKLVLYPIKNLWKSSIYQGLQLTLLHIIQIISLSELHVFQSWRFVIRGSDEPNRTITVCYQTTSHERLTSLRFWAAIIYCIWSSLQELNAVSYQMENIYICTNNGYHSRKEAS